MEEVITYVGTVKWFSSKGQPWGYINYVHVEHGPIEIFAHYKNLTIFGQDNPSFKTLAAGQVVEFVLGSGHFNAGTQALNVRVIGTVGRSGTN